MACLAAPSARRGPGGHRPLFRTRDGKPAPVFTERRMNLTVYKRQPDGRWLIHRFFDTTPPGPGLE